MLYPVIIHKDPDSDYGITVPDLPGCFSAVETLKEVCKKPKKGWFNYIRETEDEPRHGQSKK